MSDKVQNLTSDNFDSTIDSEIPVMVDFWADWCGPCKAIAPILDELAEELAGKALICKVNVEEYGEIAQRFGVSSIPNMKIFKNGVEVGNVIGAVPKPTL
jgi:thioredoxin 1